MAWLISQCRFLSLVFLLFLISSHPSTAQKKRKPIVTQLNAKWDQTPMILEASEFLAEESNDKFWDFVSFVSSLPEESLLHKTDEERHETILELAAGLVTKSQLEILRFSLSLRTHSPKIEMFRQIAADLGVTKMKCSTVFDLGGKLTCDLPEKLDIKGSDADIHNVDHIYPGIDEKAPLAVVYGEMGSPGFAKAHHRLEEAAKNGQIRYVLRHFFKNQLPGKVTLSGYGVELQIKSTEYKAVDDTKLKGDEGEDGGEDTEEEIEGFIFGKLRSRLPEKEEKLAELKQHLLDQNNDMAPMKVWQLQDLSLQATERIMKSPEDERLKVMGDIANNFPSHARALSRVSVGKDLKKEASKNRDMFYSGMNIQPSDAALYINGMHYDMEFADIFTIMDAVRQEDRVLGGLGKLGLDHKQTSALMALDLAGKEVTYGVDVRDTAVNWINNIEKDSLYKGWPDSVNELLRPTFPGMLRSIRKNFFNVVILCDPSSSKSRALLKNLESFYVHRAPTRIGLVFSVSTDQDKTGDTDAGVALVNAYNYIAMNKEPYEGLAFITDVYSRTEGDTMDVTVEDIRDAFMETYGSDVKMDDVFGEDSEYDVGRQIADDFVSRTGLGQLPQVLMNGVPIEKKYLNGEDFEEGLLTELMKETQTIQREVYKNRLTDQHDLLDWLMSRENIMPRLNQRILGNTGEIIDMVGDQLNSLSVPTFTKLDKRSMAATVTKHMKYLVGKDPSKLRMVTAWVVADLETEAGRAVARAAAGVVKTSTQVRVGFVHNTEAPGIVAKAVEAAVQFMDPSAALVFTQKMLKEDTVKRLKDGKKRIEDYDIPGADMATFVKQMNEMGDDVFGVHRMFADKVVGAKTDDVAVIINGKVVGPFDKDEAFTVDDMDLLEKLTMSRYGEKLVSAFHTHLDVNKEGLSDTAMLVAGQLITRPTGKPRQEIVFKSDKHTVINLDPRYPDKPAFDLVAVVDPVSRGAQKIVPLLLTLQQVLNANIRVFMNCVDKHSETPNKSYYRIVLEPQLQFDNSGALAAGPRASFVGMPETPILVMHYHVPDNWLVEPVNAVYDLDNIKLETIETGVYSEWRLDSLLLEGHCFEAGTGSPPRGLQLTLGTANNPQQFDTIVMANLGYLQLKGLPGAWYLNLREGRSADIYSIVSYDGADVEGDGRDIPVLMSSFQSNIVKMKVAKKPEMRNEDLLMADKKGAEEGSWMSAITNTFSGSPAEEVEPEKEGLNIFCVATGHLYERLLKIMMLTVVKTTNKDTPVKFWILKNFLSPAMKEFIPEYAARYGFEYEFVQYRWPRWLTAQNDKQRTIWGYKILFLDVLFPISLKKIIFVDTDQIVRADLTELRDFDLGGAPYGYTPFCDSNTDMEGFRFWKQGYWRNHLAGRKYHISAIYVVDLVKFRQIAAGDRLRGQYQALSQDPNSLSNLDQDLPNNMIHQVPIKSLPQEWLWCETWCSTESLKTAKTIDLCNNPLTKEPKLNLARRIVPEWTDYDEEMQRLALQIEQDKKDKKQKDLEKAEDIKETAHTEL